MIDRTITLLPNILPTLIDMAAEPRIKGTNAVDSRNQTLDLGDQAPNLLNQSRDQHLTPNLSSSIVTGNDSTFTGAGNWDTSDAGVSVAGGKLVFAGVADGDGAWLGNKVDQDIYYSLVFTVEDGAGPAGAIIPKLGGTAGTTRTTGGPYTQTIKAGSTNDRLEFVASGATTLDVDVVTIVPLGFAIASELDSAPASAPDYIVIDKHTLFSYGTDLVTGDDQDMDTVGNWVARGSATVTGGYDSGDPEHAKTLRIQAGDTTAEGASLDLSTAGATPFVDADAYVVMFDYKTVVGSDSSHKLIIANAASATLLSFFGDDFPLSVGVWTSFLQVFYQGNLITGALSDIDKAFVDANISGGSAEDELLIDNFRTFPLSAVSHYRHNADSLPAATQLPFTEVLGGDLGGTLVRQSVTAPAGVLLDSSTNDLDATLNGPKYVYDSTRSEYVLRFNGVDDYARKANDADLNFGVHSDFTLEAIVRTTQTGTGKIVEKGDNDAAGSWYSLYHSNGKLYGVVDDGTTAVFQDGSTAINDGEWHHVVCTFDRDGNAQTYIDGVADGDATSIASVGDLDDATKAFLIGIESDDQSSNPFDGDIALVRVWNHCLTAAEVLSLYNGGDVPAAYQWGAQTELMPNAIDRTFSGGGTAWANVDLGTLFNDDGDLSIRANGAGQYCTCPVASMPMVATYKYRLYFDAANIVASWQIQDFTGAQIFGTVNANGTDQFLEFTVDTAITGGVRVVAVTGAAEGDFDNWSLVRTGCVVELMSSDNAQEIRPTVDDVLIAKIDNSDTNKFWFSRAFVEGHTAAVDPTIGHYIISKSVSIAKIAKGSFTEGPAFPGIKTKRSFSGVDMASKDYGEKQSYGWTYASLTDSEKDELLAAYRLCVGSKHLLGMLIDEDGDTRYVSVKWTGFSLKRRGSRWDLPVKFVEHPR